MGFTQRSIPYRYSTYVHDNRTASFIRKRTESIERQLGWGLVPIYSINGSAMI